MKRKSSTESNPQIPRNKNGSKKKPKLTRKQYNRLRKMMMISKIKCETADRSHLDTICVTRTVEWPSTQKIGDEKSKLLFMLAIGLNPKPEATQNLPRINLIKLEPSVKSKTKAPTKAYMFEMFKKRRRDVAKLRLRTSQFLMDVNFGNFSNDKIEVVDLVSDDEGEDDQNEQTKASQPLDVRTTRKFVLLNGSSTFVNADHKAKSSSQKVVTSCPRPLQPILKKKDDKILVKKWKPESFTKLLDRNNTKSCTTARLNGAYKKLIANFKNAAQASSPLAVRNQASAPIRSTNGRITGAGGVRKTRNSNAAGGVRNVGASLTSSHENLIDID